MHHFFQRKFSTPAVSLAILFIVSAASACAGEFGTQSGRGGGGAQNGATFISASTTVRVKSDAAHYFAAAFDDLSAKAHLLIVCEGTPLRATLSDEEVQKAFPSDFFDVDVPIGAAMKSLARAYDYDVEQIDEKTFVLSKRYTDVNDLPCVTFAEMLQSLKSIVTILNTYAPVFTPGTGTSQESLFGSLTPEQQERARTGIRLADLSPEQRQLVLSALDYVVFEPKVQVVRNVALFLDRLQRTNSTFRWVEANGPNGAKAVAFGYEGSFASGNSRAVRPLSAPFKSAGPGGYSTFAIFPPAAASQAQIRLLPDAIGRKLSPDTSMETFTSDPTVPTDLDRMLAKKGMLSNRLSSTVTLREAARLAESLPADAGTLTPVHADAVNAIADKPVNLFGVCYAGTARHLIAMLAHVYGLRVSVSDPQQFLIALPRPRPTEVPEDVPVEIRRVTPLALMRALASQSEAAAMSSNGLRASDLARPQGSLDPQTDSVSRIDEDQSRRQALAKACDAYYFPAARRLIALAKPSVPTPASPPLPLSVLSPEADRLITFTAISGACLAQIKALQAYIPPPCIANPDTLVLKMANDTSGTVPVLSCQFISLRPNGTFSTTGTTWTVHIPANSTVSGVLR